MTFNLNVFLHEEIHGIPTVKLVQISTNNRTILRWYLFNGSADISATIAGLSIKIEVKNSNTGDRQSQAQKLYQQGIEQAGGVYIIATSLAQFINCYYSRFGGAR